MAISDRDQLAKLLLERSYLRAKEGESFLLASGRRSQFYFDCKATTFSAEAMPLVGRIFIHEFERQGSRPAAAGGLTQGADPIAQAIAYTSLERPPVIDAFSVRKQRKEHGTSRWIEGRTPRGSRVAVVDDVVTTGISTIRALERCREAGLEVTQVVVLVDREEGGLENIREAAGRIDLSAIFTRTELEAAMRRQSGDPPHPGVD